MRQFVRRLTVWQGLFLVILALGLYATVIRFARGLGTATHLSDSFPWGLWIGFDVLVGVGLAAGGFVIAATVHIFHIKKYEPIARPTILTAFLGYLLVIVALMYDLGRPYRIWHALVMWNPHSVMFEVAWCVMLYTTVLMLEFSPLVFERLGLHTPLRMIRAVYVPLVIIGVLLSVLHQSSLGTLYVIAPEKLHGLWYTPLLPVFFLISAVAAGLAMTIFESFMSYRAFGKRLEADLLQNLGRVIVVVLAVLAVWKLEDLALRGNLRLAFLLTPESVLFWGEVGLGVLLPMMLFAVPRVRRDEHGLFLAAVLTVMGFVVGRLNVAITGMSGSSGVRYFPSWMELAVTTAIVAAGFALFGLAVKHLPVFPQEEAPLRVRPRPTLQPAMLAVLWALLFIGYGSVSYSLRNGSAGSPAAAAAAEPPVAFAADELRLPPPLTLAASAESLGPVTFRHDTHVDADAVACDPCHRSLFRITGAAAGAGTGPPSHERCGACHDGQNATTIDDDCLRCHAAE